MRTPKICNWSGSPKCLKTAVSRGRCSNHPRIPFDGAKQRWNAARPRGYEALRRTVVRRRYCEADGCDSVGTEVDHIISVADGGSWSLENLQLLCGPHHVAKTAQDALRGRQRGRA